LIDFPLRRYTLVIFVNSAFYPVTKVGETRQKNWIFGISWY